MKEIKFRGLDYKSSKWIHGYYVKEWSFTEDFDGHDYMKGTIDHEYIINETGKHKIYYNTASNYTGLKDKNGVEIYEGDIVYCYDDCGQSEYEFKGVVVWCDSMWKIPGCGVEPLYLLERNLNYEVIGNIHENPELIEEDRDEKI